MSCCTDCDELGLSVGATGATGASGTSTVLLGAENIFVSKDGVDSTGANKDLTKSFLTIAAALTKASSLTPGATNIINVIVYPGAYAESITVPSYVNLIAVTPNELIYNTAGYATIATKSASALRPVYINGTITVASDNVNIVGVNCDTLAINTTGTNCSFTSMVVSTAITTNTNVAGIFYDVHSLAFFTSGNTFSGYYEKCTGSTYSFASRNGSTGGTISGTMVDCIGKDYCFASSNTAIGGTISGTLIRCTGTATGCFASSATTGGTISGKLTDCVANGGAFASGDIGGSISAAAILIRCIDLLNGGFSTGNTGNGGTIAGTLFYCEARGSQSFAGTYNGTTAGTISGKLFGCKAVDIAFASAYSGNGGTLSGTLQNCYAAEQSFASTNSGTAGTISGTLIDCVAKDSTTSSFASAAVTAGGTAGTISGKLYRCVGGTGNNFASADTNGGTVSSAGILEYCEGTGTNNVLYNTIVSGKLIGIRINQQNANKHGVIVATGATLTKCDLKGNGTGSSVYSAAATNIAATFLRTFGKGTHANVTNLVTTPYIVDDANDIF